MDSRIVAVVIPLAFLALPGCATEAHLTIHSQPEGAYITTLRPGSGQGLGMAPAIIHYDWDYLARHRNAKGCYVLDGVEARWASGAASSISPVLACKVDDSERYDITLTRPAEYPGLEKDFQVELQLRETRAREREADAAMSYAASARRDARAYEQTAYEIAIVRREEERRREERERHERHDDRRDRDRDASRGDDSGRDRGHDNGHDRDRGTMEMKPQVTIHQPVPQPSPAAPPPAKPAEPTSAPAYDPKDPNRPKGSKGWKGDE